MRGRVVSGGREAVISLTVLGSSGEVASPERRVEVEAAIDTGFTGHLTLPAAVARDLALPELGFVEVELADGGIADLNVHEARVLWRGVTRPVPVYIAESKPLVGMSMLRGSRLMVDVVPGGEVVVGNPS